MPRAPRIAIIGGGIGGLAAALALERRGAEVVVCEQSPVHSEIGAGLNLTPNAVKALPRARPRGRDRRHRLGLGISDHSLLEERPLHFAHPPRRFPAEIRRAQSHRAPRRSARRAARRAEDDRYPARQALHRRRGRRARGGGALCRRQRRSRPTSWSAPTAFIPSCATACSAPTRRASPAASAGAAWRRPTPCRPTSTPPTAPCGWARTAMSCTIRVHRGELAQHRRPYRQRRLDRGILDARMRRVGSDDDLCGVEFRADPALSVQHALVQMGAVRSRSARALEQRPGDAAWRLGARHAALSRPGRRHGGRGRLRAGGDGGAAGDDLDAALLAYERMRAPRAQAAVLGSRARAKENHLASPWARFKRDVRFALRERFGVDTTAFQVAGSTITMSAGKSGRASGCACFPMRCGQYNPREVGGGRTTRQPGQVRKEAALTSAVRVARQPPTLRYM